MDTTDNTVPNTHSSAGTCSHGTSLGLHCPQCVPTSNLVIYLRTALERIAKHANHQPPSGLTTDHLVGYWQGRAEGICLEARAALENLPVETNGSPSLQEALAEWDRWRPGHRPIGVLFAEVLTHRFKALEGLIAAARVSVGSPEEPTEQPYGFDDPRYQKFLGRSTVTVARDAQGDITVGITEPSEKASDYPKPPHLDTCASKYGNTYCDCGAENGTRDE